MSELTVAVQTDAGALHLDAHLIMVFPRNRHLTIGAA